MQARVTKKQYQKLHETFRLKHPLDIILERIEPESNEPEYLIVFDCFLALQKAATMTEMIKVLEFIKKNVEIVD